MEEKKQCDQWASGMNYDVKRQRQKLRGQPRGAHTSSHVVSLHWLRKKGPDLFPSDHTPVSSAPPRGPGPVRTGPVPTADPDGFVRNINSKSSSRLAFRLLLQIVNSLILHPGPSSARRKDPSIRAFSSAGFIIVQGKLEVLLISAKGLENTDFLCDMDPYVILTCRSQEQKSSVASGKGTEPEWNENFVFTMSDGASELKLKIMDSDAGTSDDFVGEATIPLEPLFEEGSLPPASYNVVKDDEYCGEIRVGLTFTPEECYDRGLPEESVGGWKESSFD